MSIPLTFECNVHLHRRAKGCQELRRGAAPVQPAPGRVPRVARLMALALRWGSCCGRAPFGTMPSWRGWGMSAGRG